MNIEKTDDNLLTPISRSLMDPQLDPLGLLEKVNDTAAQSHPQMYFSWTKAAKIIQALNVPDTDAVQAGLYGDWHYNNWLLMWQGRPSHDTDSACSSWWALPALEYQGIFYECWSHDDEGDTWTPEALALLGIDVPVPEVDSTPLPSAEVPKLER